MPGDDLTGARPGHPEGDPRVVRRGLRVIRAGVREEPAMFALAVLGSTVYGAGTAAGGWMLGRVTDTILGPAFATGRFTARQALLACGGLAAVALATSLGVVVRRAAAGATAYRLMARYRRRVTRQYLRLPLAWHHRHPTGQLLSNANADVEATWQVFAPLPMSLGVVVMILVAAAAMIAADPVLAAVGLSGGAGAGVDEHGVPAADVAAGDAGAVAAGRGVVGGARELRRRPGGEGAGA